MKTYWSLLRLKIIMTYFFRDVIKFCMLIIILIIFTRNEDTTREKKNLRKIENRIRV